MLSVCSAGVKKTVLNAGAPSTCIAYANKWKLFTSWCKDQALNPFDFPIKSILEYLQHLLDTGPSHTKGLNLLLVGFAGDTL